VTEADQQHMLRHIITHTQHPKTQQTAPSMNETGGDPAPPPPAHILQDAPAPPFSSCKSFSVLRFALTAAAAAVARAAATPGGITGGRAAASRGLGTATCMRFSTSPMRFPANFMSTRKLSRRSQAVCLTAMTPSSVRVDMVSRYGSLLSPSAAAPNSSSRSSSSSKSVGGGCQHL
jgi:hypothetical protein